MEARIARDTGIAERQVRATLSLLDDGNTVPFIARYRKEMTGNLDETQIRDVAAAAEAVRKLEDRRAYVLEQIREQGKLTSGLEKKIRAASELTQIEDLYAPYKSSRKTRAQKAIDAGLAPVAEAIRKGGDPWALAKSKTSKDYPGPQAVIDGAKDILAEEVANDAAVRGHLRDALRKHGCFVSKKRRGADEDPNFDGYYDFTSRLDRIKPHQILAVRRGENEKKLSGGVDVDEEREIRWIDGKRNTGKGQGARLFREAIEDGFKRLLKPAVERDVRSELDEQADAHAISVFAINLKNLLLQAPLADRRVLGIDPGYRTGCKMAAVDATGKLLGTGHIYVHDGRKAQAPKAIRQMVDRHRIDVVVVGNGTGTGETQEAIVEAIADSDVKYAVVDEAGASVYSASEIAREEFPDLDVSVRGAVSIARRIQDPLAELVKIDPKSIGVGMYQHDVNQNRLKDALDAVVQDVVNAVGVDLNSASAALLTHISGIGPTLAGRIVAHRDKRPFRRRSELTDIKGIGAKAFEQAAGFLRIRGGKEPLDNTPIHPENYGAARAILKAAGSEVGAPDLARKLDELKRGGQLTELAKRHGVGQYTLDDILEALVRPGRDPRGEVPSPELRSKQLKMEDLKPGMKLGGTVRNVVDFGAFVDIGVKQDGLVHVSKLANRFVKDPHTVVAVGDKVEVTVESVDLKRGRIGLSMV